jgi:stage V sporulation protein R
MGLDPYPNQIEVITTEQMLDAYASTGMPLFYRHWSFGKEFARNEALYRKGYQGLAYEIVINSNPCLSTSWRKTPRRCRRWCWRTRLRPQPLLQEQLRVQAVDRRDGILDYLAVRAQDFIAKCEERYGQEEVERVIDAAHALQSHGIHRFPRKRMADLRSEADCASSKRARAWRGSCSTISGAPCRKGSKDKEACNGQAQDAAKGDPGPAGREHLLYFLEKTAPRLQPMAARDAAHRPADRAVLLSAAANQDDERRLRDVHAPPHHDPPAREGADRRRRVSGIPALAHQRGDAAGFRRSALSGINPYALGFAMMQDIERICTNPTDEDRAWLPDIAGNGDRLRHAARRVGELIATRAASRNSCRRS